MISMSALIPPVRFFLGLICMVVSLTALAGDRDDALIEAGRRIYEYGILPDGAPLVAVRSEGFTMEGEHAACVICHRRSGMGSIEGNVENTVLVPPIAGPVLFKPARFIKGELDTTHHYVPTDAWENVLTRPAYDRDSLARALREGLNAGGRALVTPMPRFDLSDAALDALGAYIEQLSSKPSPGVSADALHLATVVTPDASPRQVASVLDVMKKWSSYSTSSVVPWELQVWELSGPADTWQAQLEARYHQQPVFAVLSGIGRSEWAPVQRFCEQYRVPCILPSVEVPPVAAKDGYSMYFSPGVTLEADILASYLKDTLDTGNAGAGIIQVYSDASGRHAAETLRSRLDANTARVSNRRLRITSPRSAVKDMNSDDVLVLWLRPDEISVLTSLIPDPDVKAIYVSSLLATPELTSMPAAWKQRVYYASLFDDTSVQGEIARIRLEDWLHESGLDTNGDRRLQADAYAACYLFNKAIGKIRDQEKRRPPVPLQRDHVLEMLETLVSKFDDSTELVDIESHVAWYGRMSLGPRQRVAVRGGTIMRYALPDSGKLVADSKRIVPIFP